ncbi:MAG TPA: molybdopterin cofactor-binding domain-containing protein [Streptosporangiaceae bacterium]|nr:molybdopterin cofactor-binding domain-containing protein [Streptosporangiaceae bacterium]
MDVRITVNGRVRELGCEPGDTLLELLRREGFASVRFGSGTGETGAAAVLLDGRLVCADVLLAAQADGHEVTTVESLDAATGELHPIQEAFVEVGALQSGYSAGAMVLAAKALAERDPDPGEAEIRDALSGILDRETGYVKVVEAVRRAAALLRGEKPGPVQPVLVEPLAGRGLAGPGPDAAGDHAAPSALPRVVASPEVTPTAVVGQPERKVDALRLVKGHPAFTDDVRPRGMLYAKVLRSPHAHARIVAIDDAEARALPGVHAVLHHLNTTRVKYASGGQSWPNPYPWDQVSFDDKVRHVGDRVAAVAAETVELAEEACRRIKVTYQVLPAVLDEIEALAPGAPVIHDEPDSVGIHDAARNISSHIEGRTVTDMEAALAGADHVFEQTFHTHQVQHCAIEPHVTIGWLDPDDRLVLRTSTQVPFHIRRMVAPLVGLPVRRIRVIKPRIGGGFGGKQEMLIEDIVGLLVLATRRPVRLELSRDEEFASSRTRHRQTITFRTGVSRDGKLLAQDMKVVANTGAYGVHGFTVQSVTGLRGLSSYNCPAKRYQCDVVYTNRLVAGAMRGYGAPQGVFALESHLDDIARALRIDPVELRRRNWVGLGDSFDIAPRLGERGGVEDVAVQDLPRITSCGTEECAAQALRAIGWHRRGDESFRRPADRPGIRRGIGFALCVMGSGIPFVDMGAAFIKMNDDGSFNLMIGGTDLGTGADTVVAQIAAEVLGVGVDDIIVYAADTDLTPFDVGAYASGTTYITGMAAKQAAEAARARIAQRAARMLSLDESAPIELRDRCAWAADGRSVPLADLALHVLHEQDQEQIMGTASYLARESPSPFAAQVAEVEVDVETGQVTVVKVVTAVDCGVPINPLTASGQVEGGVLMALGYALCEELVLDGEGRPVNGRLGPYWIYRADDAPDTEVFLIQTMEPSGPFGAKAVGEIPTVGVAPAVRNAILDATGVAISTIPFTPERVWRALREEGGPA